MNNELEKNILKKYSQSYTTPEPPKFWENSGIVDPFPAKRRQEELDKLSEYLKQLQSQQYTQSTTYATHELREVNERLRLIEGSLETLMNMLKLILTTQIEKEMRDKEKN
jgi:hypothetical protein